MPDFVEKAISPAELPPPLETGKEIGRETAPAAERAPAKEQIADAVAPAAPLSVAEPTPSAVADPITASIEQILSEDLFEHFQAMSPEDRAKFQQKGEQTVSKLTELVGRVHIKAKEVLNLIVSWLKLITGVNKYFLEQESKIKTDKILELHKRNHPD